MYSGLYLKENGINLDLRGTSLELISSTATEVAGTFRVNGSAKRMRELQAAFEAPPRVRCPVT